MQKCRNYVKLCNMVASNTIFASIVKGNGYSLTKARQQVFESLNTHESMSMGELVKSVATACDRASVYRSVELLEKLNIVQKVAIGWKYRLELSDIFKGHHHHAVCLGCERVIEFNEIPAIEAALEQLANTLNFKISDHSLELQGYCAQCRQRTSL